MHDSESCPSCHTSNNSLAMFCRKCGRKLGTRFSSQPLTETPFGKTRTTNPDSRSKMITPWFLDNWVDESGTLKSDALSDHAGALSLSSNAIVPLDTAPDGIKRYLHIERFSGGHDIVKHVRSTLGPGTEPTEKAISLAIRLQREMERTASKNNLLSFSRNGKEEQFYLSPSPLHRLMPQTLLSQTLSTTGPLDKLQRAQRQGFSPISRSRTAATVTGQGERDQSSESFVEARKKVEASRYLAISLECGDAVVITRNESDGDTTLFEPRRLIAEDMTALDARYKNGNSTGPGNTSRRGAVNDTQSYQKDLLDSATSTALAFTLEIGRAEIASLMTGLLEQIDDLHRAGLVHCDLKPQNLLVLQDKLIPIDSLDVPIGTTSIGLTPTYCAPEQILLKPVSPATDVYNFGLLCVHLLNGWLFGRTSRYTIPVGTGSVESVEVLVEPDVYLDHENPPVTESGLREWREFLCKCLAFNPSERQQGVPALKSDFTRLIGRFPPVGTRGFSPDFGHLARVDMGNSRMAPCWIVQ